MAEAEMQRRRRRDEAAAPGEADKRQRLQPPATASQSPSSRSPQPADTSPLASDTPIRSPPAPRLQHSSFGDDEEAHGATPPSPSPHAASEHRRLRELQAEMAGESNDFESDDDSDELLTASPPPLSSSSAAAPCPPRPPVPYRSTFLTGCRSVFTSYTRLNTISSGTYGVVHRARAISPPHHIVALKKVQLEESGGFPVTALREVNVLLSVSHPNIVAVHEVVVGRNNDSVYMVMDYAEHDLKHLMARHAPPSPPAFRLPQVKRLMQQLLSALAYLHARFLFHRDVKTSNLLYAHPSPSSPPALLLADFGLARAYGLPLIPYTPTVVTLWYRAPELLMGASRYGPAVDVFSAGCVMAELLRGGRPLAAGRGELEQLGRLMELLGGIDRQDEDDILGEEGRQRGWRLQAAGRGEGRLRELFPSAAHLGEGLLTDAGYALLRGMLEMNPRRRWTAEQALSSEWWEEEPRIERPDRMPRFASANENSERKVVDRPETAADRQQRRDRESRFHV